MSYTLGTAAATGAPLRLQNTIKGDSFATLGPAYGVTPAAIISMQPQLRGVPINNKTVQAYVKHLPGWSSDAGLLKYSASNNPGTLGADGKPEGFAVFTNDTQIMLPDMPRLDGKTPKGRTVLVMDDMVITVPGPGGPKQAGVNPLLAVVGVGFGIWALFGGEKKRR